MKIASGMFVALLLLPRVALAGASVWIPNGAVSAEADGPGEPVDPASKDRYPPWNAIDGDTKTAFVVVKGEALRLRLGGHAKVHHVELLPGYAKSAKTWRENRRPTKVRVRTVLGTDRRPWKIVTSDPPDTLGEPEPWWSISIEPAVEADTIEIEVLESEKGPGNRSPDVCISEIVLLTKDEAPAKRASYAFDVPLSDDRLAMPFERFRLDGDRCTDLEHDNTGGALTKFVGSCRIAKGQMRLEGQLEIREPDDVEKKSFTKTYPFRRVNRRVVLVGGYVFTN